MIDFGELFHFGIRVPDIDVAMAEVGDSMSVTWATPMRFTQTFWVPGEGYRELFLNMTNSIEGPAHIELLQGTPGTIWDPELGGPGIHHVGVWVDDVGGLSAKLCDEGWTLELAAMSPEDGYGGFTYIRSPSGMLVEPVSTAARERFDRWWGGGSLF